MFRRGASVRHGLLLVAFLAVTVLVAGCGSSGGTPAPSQTAVLQAANDAGTDPFTPSVSLQSVIWPQRDPVALAAAVSDSGGPITPRKGNEPGLYGGTRRRGSCDVRQLMDFLQAHADKAAAWASVEGIKPAQIASYVRKLTPVLLHHDTLVLNHGFRNGEATEFTSVLQAGTAVLVDGYGTPIVRCACGNPLKSTTAASGGYTYQGPRWPDFGHDTTVIIQVTVKVTVFVLVDIDTGDTIKRPRETDGNKDVAGPPLPTSGPSTQSGGSSASSSPNSGPSTSGPSGASSATSGPSSGPSRGGVSTSGPSRGSTAGPSATSGGSSGGGSGSSPGSSNRSGGSSTGAVVAPPS